MASESTRSAGGHEPYIYQDDEYHHYDPNFVIISYVLGGQQLMSGSGDKTTRRWHLQAGKEINEARIVCEPEGSVTILAVSRDGRWAITVGHWKTDEQ